MCFLHEDVENGDNGRLANGKSEANRQETSAQIAANV
jgi:hypothetical protein